MEQQNQYDVAIAGGGLAGLSCAILLAKAGHKVIVFEKESYPFHKVCGEYVSNESWNFLEGLGLPLSSLSLPQIDSLFLSSPDGKSIQVKLPLGGFGISRWLLEKELAELACRNHVVIKENSKVESIEYHDKFFIRSRSGNATARVCCAASGKHSNLDTGWKIKYLEHHDKKLDNYVAVKYHIQTEWPANMIGLHNFENGYCGISKIENDRYCLCYLTKAGDLKTSNNQLSQLEQNFLYKNPHLEKLFANSNICPGFPVTISQVNFKSKTQIEDHVLMLGDAAGMITPLCGNGMSIAMHTGKMAANIIHEFLAGRISRKAMESFYEMEWKKNFSRRLRTGRILQGFFGNVRLSNLFVQTFRIFPFMSGYVVKMTHGKPF